MAKWWAITGPAKTQLTNGVGEAAFTVTNVTASAVRGLVRVLPEGSAKPEMFKISGESTLDWAPNETKQVTVQINGQGAPPGSYVFTFAVVSEADPSELSDRLSSAFDVTEQAAKKKLPIGILIGIIAGVLLIGGVLAWLLTRGGDDPSPVAASTATPATEAPSEEPTSPPVEPPRADCLPYNPDAVHLVVEGPSAYLITDDSSRMLFLQDAGNANAALQVARSFSSHCFIGRPNTRPNRRDYIVEYWLDPSGIASPPEFGCTGYDRESLEIVDHGPAGFSVTDGAALVVLVDNHGDAQIALQLARAFSRRCFIAEGTGDEVEYWL